MKGASPINKTRQDLQSGDHRSPIQNKLSANEAWLRDTFQACEDVQIKSLILPTKQAPRSVLLVYCPGVCKVDLINQQVIPSLGRVLQTIVPETSNQERVIAAWQYSSVQSVKVLEEVIAPVFEGKVAVLINGVATAFLLDVADLPNREPSETNSEVSVKGPRDGFTEELSVNIALVRKRLKTNSLRTEYFRLGTRSQTQVALLYIEDIARPESIKEVREKLNKIDAESIYSSTQIEERIISAKFSIFPQMDYTGRPDYVVESVLKGRFVLIIDGVPTSLIAPCNLFLMLKAAEDMHTNYIYASFERILRIIGLFVAVLLPGFYVAITSYHQDQIPLSLLATLLLARKGIPFTIPLEAFLMLLLFELFREAGVRLPSKIGQTLAVVGGLIIGDAAIRSGIASPSLLVVAGTTAVTTFTLINQSLAGAVSILRLLIMILSSFLGLFGFFVGMFVIYVYMANIRSFGISYLTPVSAFSWKDFFLFFMREPQARVWKRPEFLHPLDATKEGSADDET
ncbi:hypothetical protein CIG75_10330 [Tumebacillus algifaecis]|uniref:Spore germination protein n=1 Tax=Tumebacillus algifaecis TaxID=1214604 RepID=A0A223D0R2_9BACL|nr:spore germination protein [Tumebacillus algifaecis]ASS75349.1 hypothetical protein CIG75_10330 [Tumebacillus algifaecis]